MKIKVSNSKGAVIVLQHHKFGLIFLETQLQRPNDEAKLGCYPGAGSWVKDTTRVSSWVR